VLHCIACLLRAYQGGRVKYMNGASTDMLHSCGVNLEKEVTGEESKEIYLIFSLHHHQHLQTLT
jgi:hypothetical protein